MEELIYRNALRQVSGIGVIRLSKLLEAFGSAKQAWEANPADLAASLGEGEIYHRLLSARRLLDPTKAWEKIIKAGINVTAPGMDDYPGQLATIYHPPLLLYYLGSLTNIEPTLAIVGSRRATPYGKAIATGLAQDLVNAGFVIVSGFARGIDAAAHRAVVESGGRTIAVFGSGLDVIYPKEQGRLFTKILESGAIVSEFPLGTPPLSANFPARNRIISGMCLGTLVVEGRDKSGSLITAEFALEQGRDVFAVPGPVNAESSRGPHKLIKQGAKLVEDVYDILEEYPYLGTQPPPTRLAQFQPTCSNNEVLNLFSLEPLHIDEICAKLNTSPDKIAGLLLHLELTGQIKQLNGGYYVINF